MKQTMSLQISEKEVRFSGHGLPNIILFSDGPKKQDIYSDGWVTNEGGSSRLKDE